jgi:hypothetical protein
MNKFCEGEGYMGLLLGNLNVEQIEERLGIKLTDDERIELKNNWQEEANNINKDKWHCFDLPFIIVSGSLETAQRIHNILKPYSCNMNCQLQIGY